MRKKLIFFFLLNAIFFHCSLAQCKVEGNIMDPEGKLLSNATVLLLSAKDSSLVKGTITNTSGSFAFDRVANGDYLLSCSFTGYAEVHSNPFSLAGNESKHIGNLKLGAVVSELSAVTVTAKRPLFEQSVDRLTVNVASSITSSGSTVLDVLMRSPGIMIDQQNGSISMNGKDGVVMMLNGKINRMPVSAVVQMLAGMSAANIEKIELITTPPANFDAEGNAGFINIVTKANTEFGTNGSWSATAGYGKRWMGLASMNFNHRQGKWNLYGDYSFSRIGGYSEWYFFRSVMNGVKSIDNIMKMKRDDVVTNQTFRLGLDYELNKKTTVGILASGLSNVYKMHEDNVSRIFVNDVLDTLITLKNKENHPLLHYAVNVNLLHRFADDQRLSVNLDHMYYTNDNVIDYKVDYYNGSGQFIRNENTNSKKRTPIVFYVGSIDYTRKLGQLVEWEAGLKSTISNFTNDVKVERIKGGHMEADAELTSKYYLEESIAAGYSSFNVKVSKKTAMKIGLRYEFTNSNLRTDTIKNIVDRHYGRLFPSFFFSHSLDEKNAFNLTYSRRITRPTFDDMAPFVYFVDPNTFFSGNPALQPSIANAVKGDYIFKQFIFSLAYTHEADPITNFAPKVNPVTNKQTLSSENQDSKKTLALTITAPFSIGKWWTMQNNISVISQQLNAIYKAAPLRVAQHNFTINTTQTFILPKAYTIELNAYYQSGGLFGVYSLEPLGSFNIGLQKKLSGKGGTLRLNVSDLFGPPHLKFSVDAPEHNLVTSGDLYFSNRTIQLTYARSFGNDKLSTQRTRTTGAEEEKQRVKTN